jgi:hypothetical protein
MLKKAFIDEILSGGSKVYAGDPQVWCRSSGRTSLDIDMPDLSSVRQLGQARSAAPVRCEKHKSSTYQLYRAV